MADFANQKNVWVLEKTSYDGSWYVDNVFDKSRDVAFYLIRFRVTGYDDKPNSLIRQSRPIGNVFCVSDVVYLKHPETSQQARVTKKALIEEL